MPLISIVMATRNSQRHIGEALASIRPAMAGLDATFEVLVADASSHDDTLHIAANLPETRIVSRADSGIYDGMNRALAAASGAYVIILNSDDQLAPGSLIQAIKELERNAGCGFASGGASFGAAIETATFLQHSEPLSAEGALFGIPVINARVFRTELIRRQGPLLTKIGLGADREYLVRLVRSGTHGCRVDAPLYFYRAHQGSSTISGDADGRRRVHAANAQLSHYFLEQASQYEGMQRLARQALAVAYIKHRLCRGDPGKIRALGEASFTIADSVGGFVQAARWRGKLSGY